MGFEDGLEAHPNRYYVVKGRIREGVTTFGVMYPSERKLWEIKNMRFFRDGRLTTVTDVWGEEITQAEFETHLEFGSLDLIEYGAKFYHDASGLTIEVRPLESTDRSPTCPKEERHHLRNLLQGVAVSR